jgi:hypothetical protein
MNSMAIKRYKIANAMNLRRGYRKPYVVRAPILDHGDGHYVRPNKVALKYPDFKKDVDLVVHARVFNFAIKENVETFEDYIINVFSYMLKDTTSNWCHNYMSKFPNCIFWSLHKHFANVIKRLKIMSKYTWS